MLTNVMRLVTVLFAITTSLAAVSGDATYDGYGLQRDYAIYQHSLGQTNVSPADRARVMWLLGFVQGVRQGSEEGKCMSSNTPSTDLLPRMKKYLDNNPKALGKPASLLVRKAIFTSPECMKQAIDVS